MTKVNKISDDLLQFINEDTGIAETCKGDLAIKKFNELQSSAVDMSIQDKKSHDYTLGLFWELMQGDIDNKDFKKYLNSKSSTSTDIETGRIIFNEDKYNAKVIERENKMRSLIDKYNSIISNMDFDLQTRERAASDIMNEFNAVKRSIISRSEKEFHEKEFESIEISANEAFKNIKGVKSRYDKLCEQERLSKYNKDVEHDKCLFQDVDDEDFKFVKRLHKLVDHNVFYEMFEHNHYNEWKSAIQYESLNDYIERDRDYAISEIEIKLSDIEMTSIRYVHKIYKMWCLQCRENKLIKGRESMTLD